MWKVLIAIVLLQISSAATAQTQYFPKGIFSNDASNDQFVDEWYSEQLTVLKEPSEFNRASNPSLESYRFLWLRTFHHPIAVRIDLSKDGSAVLTTKMASGAAGFPNKRGYMIENISRPLLPEQTQELLLELNRTCFWQLPAVDQYRGDDGAEWIVEGVKNGKYHLVTRWSPQEGPVHELGLVFIFGLAHMPISRKDIY